MSNESETYTQLEYFKDDYLCQEQYVVELPDILANEARHNPRFEFDLAFDVHGQSGKCIILSCSHGRGIERSYPFRVFRLPLATESYTSSDGQYYFKNADVSDIIVVYEKTRIPQVLIDYEVAQKAFLLMQATGNPVVDPSLNTCPHGLTPASAWAPFTHWPQIPLRPRFFPQMPPDAPHCHIAMNTTADGPKRSQ